METEFTKDLAAAVASLYAEFGRGTVSEQLETCSCPVCMTEETRLSIIATPNWELSEAQICEYSNSAHGIPENFDDLRLLLPRYAELVSSDVSVDYTGVGTELRRFGEAQDKCAQFLTDAQYQAYANWAEILVLHFGVLEATEGDNIECPGNLFGMLICGGIKAADITNSFNKLFLLPDHGAIALRQFADVIVKTAQDGTVSFDLFPFRYVALAERQIVADWLNGPHLTGLLKKAAKLDDDDNRFNGADQLQRLQARITPDSLPGND